MGSLQIGLIVAGVVLVIAVLVYNIVQERRVRRQIESAFRKPPHDILLDQHPAASSPGGNRSDRIEPVFAPDNARQSGASPSTASDDDPYADESVIDDAALMEQPSDASSARPQNSPLVRHLNLQPDRDTECVIILQPARPVGAGTIPEQVPPEVGKPVRWLGRRSQSTDWQEIDPEVGGEFVDVAVCLLLANRNGAATVAQLQAFCRMVEWLAPLLPAAFVLPAIADEVAKAETLDGICAELDVQIGITLLKQEGGQLSGTRIRGVAEAAGLKLSASGTFDYMSDEAGALLFSMQNLRNEPFTLESLRNLNTPGLVFLLDVPRTPDPMKAFDQMRMMAKRLAGNLDGVLVDDNKQPLTDAAFSTIRAQVEATAKELRANHIEPGSGRGLRLFG